MRVAMIVSGFPPIVGGTEHQAASLSGALAAAGVDVAVVTRRAPGAPAREERKGVDIRRMGSARMRSISFFLRGLWHLLTRRPAPDVLHAHMLASTAVLACAVGRLRGVKTLVKIACAGPYGDLATSRATFLGRVKERFVLSAADMFVCVSQESLGELSAAGVPAAKAVLISNGVDGARFRPAGVAEKAALRRELGLEPGTWVLFSGRLTAQKRPALLLEAFLKAAERFPAARLLYLGEGELRADLERRAAAAPPGRVVFAGARPDAAPVVRACDIFVLPSDAEGLSNSLLEAMSAGLACAASDIGGNRDVLRDGRNGRLFPPADAQALAAVLEEFLRDGGRAEALGAAACGDVERNHRLPDVARRYAELYESMLDGKREASHGI